MKRRTNFNVIKLSAIPLVASGISFYIFMIYKDIVSGSLVQIFAVLFVVLFIFLGIFPWIFTFSIKYIVRRSPEEPYVMALFKFMTIDEWMESKE